MARGVLESDRGLHSCPASPIIVAGGLRPPSRRIVGSGIHRRASSKSGKSQMQYRTFGRTGWSVGEIGYGMWGLAGWTGSEDEETRASLDRAVQLGCNFFDTAWAYGDGRSEQMLGHLVHTHPENELYVATKLPPKNRTWPSRRGFTLDDASPDYIHEYAEKSLRNLELTRIDLLQFHVWEDSWAHDKRWQRRSRN